MEIGPFQPTSCERAGRILCGIGTGTVCCEKGGKCCKPWFASDYCCPKSTDICCKGKCCNAETQECREEVVEHGGHFIVFEYCGKCPSMYCKFNNIIV